MIDDCCLPPQASINWNDLQQAKPQDILGLVANAALGVTTGSFINSANFANPGTSWVGSPLVLASNPVVVALGTDNLQNVADAAQWNFQNQTANLAATNAIPLQKVIFLRAGTQWQMNIPINFGGSTYTEVQLGFRDSAATRGDAQGTYPVIDWTGSFTGNVTLGVTLKMPGVYNMGLWAKSGSNFSMFEMQWNVVSDMPQEPVSLSPLAIQSLATSNLGGGQGGGNTGLAGCNLALGATIIYIAHTSDAQNPCNTLDKTIVAKTKGGCQ